MKILLISPLVYPVNADSRYVGIERLVWEFANELCKKHNIAVVCHKDSQFPDGVVTFKFDPGSEPYTQGEACAYQFYHHLVRDYDVIHDFSHSHFASRYNPALRSVNPFWHAPHLAKYPKAPYNIIAPSKWAKREFERVYGQNARVMDSIVIDKWQYTPNWERGDRFLTLGRMAPEKGNLTAVLLCRESGLNLDVAGGRATSDTGAPLTDYETAIKSMCDGDKIRFLGEVSEEEKLKLMHACKALVYITPPDYAEVTSHKIQEALFCGASVIACRSGANPEIITHKVNGCLCWTEREYKDALLAVDSLNPKSVYEDVVRRWSTENVVEKYVELYKEVANGLHW